MEPAELERAGASLAEARADAEGRLRDLTASFDDIVEASQVSNVDDEHDVEGATIADTRGQVAALAAQGRRQLLEIAAAEERIAAGTYGVCTNCGRPIGQPRLEARPAASLCIDCASSSRR